MTAQPGFLSDLVGNPEDRFSHDAALIKKRLRLYADTAFDLRLNVLHIAFLKQAFSCPGPSFIKQI